MSESEDIRAFIRELFKECDRKLDAWEARIEKDREGHRAHGSPQRVLEQLDFTEDRRQRALLLEKARRLGKRRPEPP